MGIHVGDAKQRSVVRVVGTDVEGELLYVGPNNGKAKVRIGGRHVWIDVGLLELAPELSA